MEQLQFYIRGIGDDQARQWKRWTSPRGRFLPWAAVAVAGYILLGPTTASIGGASVSAYRLLVLVDNSTSMSATAVRLQLDRFRAATVTEWFRERVPHALTVQPLP